MDLFGLHIKNVINLNIFGATFGIGGAIAPIALPLGTRLAEQPTLQYDNSYMRSSQGIQR